MYMYRGTTPTEMQTPSSISQYSMCGPNYVHVYCVEKCGKFFH